MMPGQIWSYNYPEPHHYEVRDIRNRGRSWEVRLWSVEDKEFAAHEWYPTSTIMKSADWEYIDPKADFEICPRCEEERPLFDYLCLECRFGIEGL